MIIFNPKFPTPDSLLPTPYSLAVKTIKFNKTRGIPQPCDRWGWIARRQITIILICVIIKLVADPPD
ncbi:MAG: hypothetical protein F6K63_14830 [Moorea sp. SIO1G6]|uniref:hypothetical protein n=1 Tax=unclassified Moorena TaxID=2683338 RepID=UPI0013BB07EF|nr:MULTISPECIES: hypothetical protein [unclassified Moorena]NEQ07485.1 hypothetical protein [Moorena sp. SIO4E2]NET65590.1 hypothetical protein [Moorena sp. SIO1G6]